MKLCALHETAAVSSLWAIRIKEPICIKVLLLLSINQIRLKYIKTASLLFFTTEIKIINGMQIKPDLVIIFRKTENRVIYKFVNESPNKRAVILNNSKICQNVISQIFKCNSFVVTCSVHVLMFYIYLIVASEVAYSYY